MMRRLPKILAVDDDPIWLEQLGYTLEDDCELDCYTTIDQGIHAAESIFYDIVILDLNFEGDERTGHDLFRRLSAADHCADVIVMSAETRPERLIQILNAGVTRFVPKPATPGDLRLAVQATLQQREMRLRAINAAAEATGDDEVHLVGSSPQIQRLREDIDRIVRGGIKDILLLGETGTGKEVVAKLIARLADSSRRLIPIHCGAISDGLAESELFGHVKGAFTGAERDRPSAFETVGGGFIFFDEIGDMPPNQQAKLLRVLQERQVQRVGSLEERRVNFRSISATNVNLEQAISARRFREDLYYRVAKETIRIPALRDRLCDVPELIQYFLARKPKSQRCQITPEGVAILQAYHWPGNVRQLKTIIESLESRCTDRMIREKDICHVLPELADIMSSRYKKALVGTYGVSLISAEKERFLKALTDAQGNRSEAAKLLKLSRATYFRRARELGLIKDRKSIPSSAG